MIPNDYYTDYFDETNKKIVPKERTLSHLAANYIPINNPATLKEKTMIYLVADGVSDKNWGFWAVKVLNDGTKQPEGIILDNTTFEGSKVYDKFGGTDLTNIKQIILIPSRLTKVDKAGELSYKYLAAMTPSYLKKVRIYQYEDLKYEAEWQWNETEKKLELLPEPKDRQTGRIKARKGVNVKLEFTKPMKEIKAGIGEVTENLVAVTNTDDREWEGVLPIKSDISLNNGERPHYSKRR